MPLLKPKRDPFTADDETGELLQEQPYEPTPYNSPESLARQPEAG